MSVDVINEYQRRVESKFGRGIATEHSYRSDLEELVKALDHEVQAINEPKRIACGAPDYVVSRKVAHGWLTIGYIEAKDVGVNLDGAQESEQLQRYRTLPNLVLTDYLEFRWYRSGKLTATARLGEPSGNGIDWADSESVQGLLMGFLQLAPEQIKSPKELAQRMARLTHVIRSLVVGAFDAGLESENIVGLKKAFETTLIPHLETSEFADMFAQTLAYGLFAARANDKGNGRFERIRAASLIPKTNPFLRKLFTTVTGPDLDDEPFSGIVDDLSQLLADTDIDKILEDFGKQVRDDPVIHFYETFLAEYDPKIREMRGVYYTPKPVVRYIIRSVDELLRSEFSCPDGLSDTATVAYERTDIVKGEVKKTEDSCSRVLVLDPACGTGTFLYHLIYEIRSRFIDQGNAGLWSSYVREHLLPRFYGFELLMAPYAVAHLKLGLQLAADDLPTELRDSWAYDFEHQERLGIFLTNSLEEAERKAQAEFGFLKTLGEESDAALRVKSELPIMVVLGNPPYSGHSANKGTWIRKLVEDYKEGCPELRKPAQAKWLQDDYVKFFRFGQWRIQQTGAGVLAFITNNGYLDNPTFRGMRRDLLQTFSKIYILDLHGNATKKETTPEGKSDKNVFDIKQGVAIGIFVREPGHSGLGTVHHADLWGDKQEGKYDWLSANSLSTTAWTEIDAQEPTYLFKPENKQLRAEYEKGVSLRSLMSVIGDPAPGIVTTHDQFAISWTEEEAIEKVERLLATASETEARGLWKLCGQSQWKYDRAKSELAVEDWRRQTASILYRPFDHRWTVFNRNVAVHRRERVMRHLIGHENRGLIATRQTKEDWDVFVTDGLAGHKSCASYDINYVFPTYLYPVDSGPRGMQPELIDIGPWPKGKGGRIPNFEPDQVRCFSDATGFSFVPDGCGDLKDTFGPEDLFAYIYAVLYAPSLRARYQEFLVKEFPFIPLPADGHLFAALVEHGSFLMNAHLLDPAAVGQIETSYPIKGDDVVAANCPVFIPNADDGEGDLGKVSVNATQYFDGVPEEVWEYCVGGYQVCRKWLVDRRGRKLTHHELARYQHMVASLRTTTRIAGEIDSLVEPLLPS